MIETPLEIFAAGFLTGALAGGILAARATVEALRGRPTRDDA